MAIWPYSLCPKKTVVLERNLDICLSKLVPKTTVFLVEGGYIFEC